MTMKCYSIFDKINEKTIFFVISTQLKLKSKQLQKQSVRKDKFIYHITERSRMFT